MRLPWLQAGFVTLTQRGMVLLELVAEALDKNPVLQKVFIEYILLTYPEVEIDDLIEKLHAIKASEMEGLVGTIAETLEAKGEARGIAKGEALGIAKGRAEGEAKSLIRLLERRFGPLPQAVRDRIAGANLDQLDTWIDRVLDAKSLDAVFGTGDG